MEFTFLGTSAGTPTRSRNVTGLALCHSGPKPWYLMDCGEGTQHYQGQLFLAQDFNTYRLGKDLSLSCLTTETTAP